MCVRSKANNLNNNRHSSSRFPWLAASGVAALLLCQEFSRATQLAGQLSSPSEFGMKDVSVCTRYYNRSYDNRPFASNKNFKSCFGDVPKAYGFPEWWQPNPDGEWEEPLSHHSHCCKACHALLPSLVPVPSSDPVKFNGDLFRSPKSI